MYHHNPAVKQYSSNQVINNNNNNNFLIYLCYSVIEGTGTFAQTPVVVFVQVQDHRVRESFGLLSERSDPSNVEIYNETLVVSKSENHTFAAYNGRAVRMVR